MSPLSSSKDNPIQELLNEIIIMLDPEHQGESSDWRDFAQELGCDMTRITWLGTQHSPTRLLMDKWLEENRSFHELSKLMLEINRPDVAGEINNKLPSIEKFDRSKTGSISEYEYVSYDSIQRDGANGLKPLTPV